MVDIEKHGSSVETSNGCVLNLYDDVRAEVGVGVGAEVGVNVGADIGNDAELAKKSPSISIGLANKLSFFLY